MNPVEIPEFIDKATNHSNICAAIGTRAP